MSGTAARATIRIAAALILDRDGRCLLVRKRGSTALMQPGGKIDAGETPEAALVRELAEELALAVDPTVPRFLGTFSAEAVNEPGHRVEAQLFHLAQVVIVETGQHVHQYAQWHQQRDLPEGFGDGTPQ